MSFRDEYETEKNSSHRTFAGDHSYREWLANKGREAQLAELGYYPPAVKSMPRRRKGE